jgi:Hg(II)-responsive transcriptional regulator
MLNELLSRGELAKRCGINPETLRFYERERLLPLPARRANGYRQYTEETAARVRFIRRSQSVGFTLDEIRQLLALQDGVREGVCGDVRGMVQDKLHHIERQLAHLHTLQRVLSAYLEDCPGGDEPLTCCPILAAFSDGDPG